MDRSPSTTIRPIFSMDTIFINIIIESNGTNLQDYSYIQFHRSMFMFASKHDLGLYLFMLMYHIPSYSQQYHFPHIGILFCFRCSLGVSAVDIIQAFELVTDNVDFGREIFEEVYKVVMTSYFLQYLSSPLNLIKYKMQQVITLLKHNIVLAVKQCIGCNDMHAIT